MPLLPPASCCVEVDLIEINPLDLLASHYQVVCQVALVHKRIQKYIFLR